MHKCPECGRNTLRKWWQGVSGDPGDVEPRAICIAADPSCAYGY